MPTWTLTKDFRFEAAHHLPHHDGKCKRVHGHSWKGSLIVEATGLCPLKSKTGMVMDYGDLSRLVEPLLLDYLDHHNLNETLELESPTSELIARWVWMRIKPFCPLLVAVVIEETCTSRCEYRGD